MQFSMFVMKLVLDRAFGLTFPDPPVDTTIVPRYPRGRIPSRFPRILYLYLVFAQDLRSARNV